MDARTASAAVFVSILAVSWSPAAAATPDDVAETMFQRGLADMLAERYASGCPAIAESLRLDARPGTLFTLAECEARAGLVANALGHYQAFLQLIAGLPPEAAQRQRERQRIASEQRARLSQQIASLTIRLPREAPQDTVVRRDGAVVGKDALGATINVDPGPHAVTLAAPGVPGVERHFVLGPGERKELTFAAAEVAPAGAMISLASPPRPGQDLGPRRLRWKRWGTRVAIAGLVLAAAGGGALWIAKRKVDAIERARDQNQPFDLGTGDYPNYQAVGAGLLASGAIALITGVSLYGAGSRAPLVSSVGAGTGTGVMVAIVGGAF